MNELTANILGILGISLILLGGLTDLPIILLIVGVVLVLIVVHMYKGDDDYPNCGCGFN